MTPTVMITLVCGCKVASLDTEITPGDLFVCRDHGASAAHRVIANGVIASPEGKAVTATIGDEQYLMPDFSHLSVNAQNLIEKLTRLSYLETQTKRDAATIEATEVQLNLACNEIATATGSTPKKLVDRMYKERDLRRRELVDDLNLFADEAAA